MIMQAKNDIFHLLRESADLASRQAQRGVILQPGAIGDCILTLPLAKFMKENLELGGIDILGHTEYIGILPGRTCVDSIHCIDSLALHRLFSETKAFDLADGDPLINAFADYAWIATFLGEPNSNFEQNLIFTANCSHSAEVVTLSMKPPPDYSHHLTGFYIRQFINQSGLSLPPWQVRLQDTLITATQTDIQKGKELLKEIGLNPAKKLVIIQPGSGAMQKCWHLDNFLAIAKELVSQGVGVLFLLGPAELDRFPESTINAINRIAQCLSDLPLMQVLGLLSCADGFIGNDSGITHLAAGLGIRTLAVFGPTNPTVYGPIGPAVTVFSDSIEAFTQKPSARLQKELLDALTA